MIELKNVTKTYAEGNYSLMDVNLQINKGEFVFIVGGSGAGKTALLQLLIAEDKPTEGTISVADQRLDTIKRRQIPQYRRKIGIVFRDFRLFTDKTVYENVAFALRVTGEPSGSIRTKVMASLQMVELSDKVKCYPGDLTGCEQQRVALARAIAGGPNVIIADEPCGNIDPVESRDLMELFGRIQSRYEKTVVVLTHDRELAESFGHRIVRLHRGQIVEDRAAYIPGDLSEPESERNVDPAVDEVPRSVLIPLADASDVIPGTPIPIAPIVVPTVDLPAESTDSAKPAASEEATLDTSAETVEASVPVLVEEEPVYATGDTIEYDLSALVASGEMDSHTAKDLVIAAMQMLGLPIPAADEPSQATVPAEPVESAESESASAADSEECEEPTIVLPVQTESREVPADETDDSPTMVIPVITAEGAPAKEED